MESRAVERIEGGGGESRREVGGGKGVEGRRVQGRGGCRERGTGNEVRYIVSMH